MKQRKYLGETFDNNWKCVDVGINNIQSSRRPSPYHVHYYYILERVTSDSKCIKSIKVEGSLMCKIARGEVFAEDVANRRLKRRTSSGVKNVDYKFF
jgi:hypothetical protein